MEELISDREAVQRYLLQRNRMMATGLLLLMAIAYVALKMVPDPTFPARLAMAGSEAAIIGALADWFAVTALFRHPLGLPFPHTAIVPRNKERIGEGLRRFVEKHFLDPAIVSEKLKAAEPIEMAAHWLSHPANARRLAVSMVGAGPNLIRTIESDGLRTFVAQALGHQMHEIAISPLLGKAVALLLSSGQHKPLLDRLVLTGIGFINRHEGQFQALVGQRSNWWVPRSVDRRLAHSVVEALKQMLLDLSNPASQASRELDAAFRNLVKDLENSSVIQAQFEQIKDRIIEQPEIEQWIDDVWTRLRSGVMDDLEAPDSKALEWLAASLQSIGETLNSDAELRAKLNALLQQLPYAIPLQELT